MVLHSRHAVGFRDNRHHLRTQRAGWKLASTFERADWNGDCWKYRVGRSHRGLQRAGHGSDGLWRRDLDGDGRNLYRVATFLARVFYRTIYLIGFRLGCLDTHGRKSVSLRAIFVFRDDDRSAAVEFYLEWLGCKRFRIRNRFVSDHVSCFGCDGRHADRLAVDSRPILMGG